jgi:hypothetical protein
MKAWQVGVVMMGITGLALAAKSKPKAEEVLSLAPKAPIEDTAKSPLGCRDLGYRYDLNTLSIQPHTATENQSLYFFYNQRSQPVRLYHMLGDKTARSTYLNHTIEPHQWAALATGLPELKYLCAVNADKDNLGNMVNCQDSIKVCEFARVRFGLNNRGNYWIVKGNTRNGAVAEVVHYGIIPQ